MAASFIIVLAVLHGSAAVMISKETEISFVGTRLYKAESASVYGGRKDTDTKKGLLYVLAGTEKSLKVKLRTAARLYEQGAANCILIFGRPGITAYDPKLGRNLTNDEWSVRELTKLGVEGEDIEFITLKDGLFGTLSEAMTLKALSVERRMQRLLLVCSAYHSKRVWRTFSALLEGSGGGDRDSDCR